MYCGERERKRTGKMRLVWHHWDPAAAAAAAKSLQSCPTLCGPRDGSPLGTPVPGTLQARTLEWVAISFSNACNWKVKVKSLSHVRLPVTPWSAAYQAPPSMGLCRQEYWRRLPYSASGGIKWYNVYKAQVLIHGNSFSFPSYWMK